MTVITREKLYAEAEGGPDAHWMLDALRNNRERHNGHLMDDLTGAPLKLPCIWWRADGEDLLFNSDHLAPVIDKALVAVFEAARLPDEFSRSTLGIVRDIWEEENQRSSANAKAGRAAATEILSLLTRSPHRKPAA